MTKFSIQSTFFYIGSQSALIRYGLAVLVVVATSLATIYVPVIGERAAFLLFFFGIIQVSFWLGLYPGILAAILSLASVNLFVLLSTVIEVGDAVLLNAGFCFVSALMVVTTGFHRQLAQALWESRQNLAHAQTVGQIGSWRLNVARNELTWSDENYRIFGIPKSTPMTYEAFLAIVHPDDREYVDHMWQAGLRGEPYDIEHRLVVAGKVKWVREKAVLEFDNKGNLLGGFGITQDVTRHKDLQDQLTKIAASVPGLICSFRLRPDGSACMPYASPVIDAIYGIGIEVVSEDFNPVFARIHPDDIGRIHASIAESARSQQPWRDTYRYNHPIKGEVWHEGHSMPVREADGSILWHGYVHDVTERKLAENTLRNSEARLALIVDQVKAGYWDLIGRQLFLSPEAKQQIGFDDSDIPFRREEWEERLHPDDRAFVLKLAEDYAAGLQPHYEVEFRLRHKDGNYRWFHSRGVLLSDLNNRPYRMLGINLDITEYMRQKQLSGRRDKIEQSFRLYVAVQTAAAIAHELNQPLAAISSYADVALHLLQTDSSNQQKLSQLLENCSTQAQRAGDVIRQLLALLQKEEEMPSEALDINLAVQEAIDLVNVDELTHAFTVQIDLAPDLPLVTANALQVQKVLINLLRNGMESMQEQGESTGRIVVITSRSAHDPSMVQVTVRDSGKGVEDVAKLRKIFQPFYTTKPQGLGMGLAISRSLIVAHGGKMWAERNVDQGLSIHFTLPFAV